MKFYSRETGEEMTAKDLLEEMWEALPASKEWEPQLTGQLFGLVAGNLACMLGMGVYGEVTKEHVEAYCQDVLAECQDAAHTEWVREMFGRRIRIEHNEVVHLKDRRTGQKVTIHELMKAAKVAAALDPDLSTEGVEEDELKSLLCTALEVLVRAAQTREGDATATVTEEDVDGCCQKVLRMTKGAKKSEWARELFVRRYEVTYRP